MKQGLGGSHCICGGDTAATGHIFGNHSMGAGGDQRNHFAESAGRKLIRLWWCHRPLRYVDPSDFKCICS